MIRMPLMMGVLAGVLSFGQAASAANAPAPKLSKLERTAQHVFQLADADRNGSLDQAEQTDADLRAEKAIRQLVHDNTIGGHNRFASVAEPQLADPAGMTGPEFTQHFQALVANKDTALRASRIAKHQVPMAQPSIGQAPVVATVRDRGRDQSDFDRNRDRRSDRDDRHFSPPQAVYQPHPLQHSPQPVFSPPVHHGTPAPVHHESGGKHEPGHGHDSSKGDSHGHGGHHGK